jgi:hypothetical protein
MPTHRRIALLSGLALVGLFALVPGAGASHSPTAIAGKWSGTVAGRVLIVKVAHNEEKGTWSLSASCHGTLKLESISNGFHHFYRIGAADTTCAPSETGGVDCLMREGSALLDLYAAPEGGGSGDLVRTH